MKAKEIVGKLFKTKKVRTIGIAILELLVVAACVFPFVYNGKAKADTEMLIHTLQEASELTTATLNYKGMTEFEDGGVAFISKADFIMVYEATARIGIDIDEVKVSADDINKIIYITVPKAEVQDVKVVAKSIKYFDEDFALFNVDEKEDGNEAIDLAEKEAKKEIEKMGGLQMADNQAAELIKGILANAIPDGYEIRVKK